MKVRLGLAAGVAGLSLVLVGCGELDSGEELSGPRARFAEQADPICEETRAAVGGKLGVDPAKERAAIQAGLDKLKALPQPSENIEKLQVFLNWYNNMGISMEDVVQSRIVNNAVRADTALSRARESDKEAAAAAQRYGFEGDCSRTIEGGE